jgi:hypothetical protein
MRDLVKAAAEVQKFFARKPWKYCFIGGLAVQKWGQVRITQDIDLTVFTGFGDEGRLIDELLKSFRPRIPHARAFAIQNRVLLLLTSDGIGIDISCGAFPFEASAVVRAKNVQVVSGIRLRLCTAEDLVIYKAFADRPIDWLDVEGIVAKQRRKLDWKYVFAHLEPLAEMKDEPEIVGKLKTIIRADK